MKNILSHLRNMDWLIVGCVFSLVFIGLLSIYSSSFFRDDFVNFKKQLFFFVFGFALMFIISFSDWRFLRDQPYIFLFLYFICNLFLLFLLLFGVETKGIKGWYRFGLFSFDPVEVMKIILIVLLAKYFSSRHIEMYNIKHILISGLYVFLPFTMIFLQPDMGSALILFFLWLGILIVSNIGIKHFLLMVLIFSLVSVFAWSQLLMPYQRQRVLSFLSPQLEILGSGWSQFQSKVAIGSGGLTGKGFMNGTQVQLGFLSLCQTDFIFSAIAEEFGFVGITVLFFLISFLLFRILKIGFSIKANFPRLVALGISVLFISQTFIHIGMNLGVLPVIGISLPFVSYGGSGLVCNFIALGILQSLKIHKEQ